MKREFNSKYPFRWVIKYIPSYYTNLKDWQEGNRKAVYDFKKGVISEEHKKLFLENVRYITEDKASEWVIAFVPTHNNDNTIKRFSGIAKYLEDHQPCPVLLNSIWNDGNYERRHIDGETQPKYHVFVEKDFEDKNVVLIDDVITTGKSFRQIGDKLKNIKGVGRIYGVIFAMTIHPELPKRQY